MGIEGVIDDAKDRAKRAHGVLAALDAMQEILPMVTKVQELVGVIAVSGLSVKDQKTLDKAKVVVGPLSDQMRDNLDSARRIAGSVPDPLAEGDYETNLGESLVGASPGWREIDDIMHAGQTFVDHYADVYRCLIAEIVHIGQRAEQSFVRAASSRAMK